MPFDVFRPHWRHFQCGGIVAGVGNEFNCTKCGVTARAIGATIPAGALNRDEYFISHPELEVMLLDEAETAAYQEKERRQIRWRQARVQWIGRAKQWAGFR